jgi:hypothetical protein
MKEMGMMESNGDIFQSAAVPVTQDDGKNPRHTVSLVLGILSIVFGLLFAIAGDILAIIGIVMSVRKRKIFNVKAGLICSIIGLVLSIGNHIVSFMLLSMLS